MKKKNRILIFVPATTLIILVVIIMYTVSLMQGNGRVVNYAGIVRGATQRPNVLLSRN